MALSLYSIRFIESALGDGLGGKVVALRMLELGDQTINDPKVSEKTGKQYFSNRGFEHRNEVIDGLRCVVVRKTGDNPFMQDQDGFCQAIAERPFNHSYKWARLRGIAIRLGLRRPINFVRRIFG